MTEVKLKKMLVDGEQIYVQTNAAGVVGLNDAINKKMIEAVSGNVSSVNNQTGSVVLTASDVGALPDTTSIPSIPGNATSTTAGLMAAEDKAKLDLQPNITFEEVGEVNE